MNNASKTADLATALMTAILVALVFMFFLQEVTELYGKLLEWFYSLLNWPKFLGQAKVVFIALNIALAGFIIWTTQRHASLFRRPPEVIISSEPPTLAEDEAHNRWKHIRKLANSSNSSDWNMAVLHADALLDDILQHRGYEGTTAAERLKTLQTTDPSRLPSLERVWSAHRLRNMIAHDPMEQHTRETIIHALRSYEKALKELGVLKEEKSETAG